MSWLAWENEKHDPEPVGTNHKRKAMKSKNKAMSVAKGAGCVVLLFTSLFPIYWLLAMAIRPTDEMKGQISLIPHTLTGEHFL